MKIIEQTPFTLSPLEERVLNNPTIYTTARRRTYIILKHLHEENIRHALNKQVLNAKEFVKSVNEVLATFDMKIINSDQTFYNYSKKLSEFKLIEELYYNE